VKRHRQEASHVEEGHENVLLRSAVESDRKFWSGERPISVVQGIGLLLMFLVLIGAMGLVNWPKSEAPWWEKIVNGYGVIVAVFGCVVLFIVLGNRRVRRKIRAPEKQ
jgi:hypothetical protein